MLIPMLSESLGNRNQDILQIGSLESVGEFSLCAWLLFSENGPAISDGKLFSGESIPSSEDAAFRVAGKRRPDWSKSGISGPWWLLGRGERGPHIYGHRPGRGSTILLGDASLGLLSGEDEWEDSKASDCHNDKLIFVQEHPGHSEAQTAPPESHAS